MVLNLKYTHRLIEGITPRSYLLNHCTNRIRNQFDTCITIEKRYFHNKLTKQKLNNNFLNRQINSSKKFFHFQFQRENESLILFLKKLNNSYNKSFKFIQLLGFSLAFYILHKKFSEEIDCEYQEENLYSVAHIGPDTSISVPHVQTQEEATLHARTKLRIQDTSEIIRLNIATSIADTCLLETEPLQKIMYLQKGETSMAFIRVYNPTEFAVRIISVAIVSPVQAVAHLVKQQCFCFEEFTIGGNESLDLPIVFYIDANCPPVENITVDYLFMLQR